MFSGGYQDIRLSVSGYQGIRHQASGIRHQAVGIRISRYQRSGEQKKGIVVKTFFNSNSKSI